MVQTVQQSIVIPHAFIDKEFDVPVVQVLQVRVQFVRRQSRSHSCSSVLCVDTVVHMPVAVQRQMPSGSDVTVAVTSRG